MKRLLFSALLALGLHGLLLALNPEWIPKGPVALSRPEPLTLALAYRTPEASKPSLSREIPANLKPPRRPPHLH